MSLINLAPERGHYLLVTISLVLFFGDEQVQVINVSHVAQLSKLHMVLIPENVDTEAKSQYTEKHKYCVILLVCGILKKYILSL